MEVSIPALYSRFLSHPNICTDTRKIVGDSIFFALKGESFNGNKFALEALNKGCELAVIDEVEYAVDERFVLVEDVLTTLQDLALHHRRQLKIPIIGITGSNGKTTTKELIHAVLKQKYNCYATPGNFNNHIGVPLTLLAIRKKHEIAVVEMGANHKEEIAELCAISRPDYGIITNIGKAHLEGFGGLDGVIYAKNKLYDSIRSIGGTLFVNGDDELLSKLSEGIDRILFGQKQDFRYSGELTVSQPFLSLTWKRSYSPGEEFEIHTQLVGSYNFPNLMAAICIADHFGVSPEHIKKGLEAYKSDNNRSQVIKKGSNDIVLDAYNANPSSMQAALQNFASHSGEGKMVILGDMFELGDYSAEEHQNIVDQVTSLNIEHVVLVGEHFAKANLPDHFQTFENTEDAAAFLKENLPHNRNILIKGSRGIRLEKILEIWP